MSFNIYEENKILNTQETKTKYKSNGKATVLRDLQVNGRQVHKRSCSPGEKKLNLCIEKLNTKHKFANDISDSENNFDVDGGKKKPTEYSTTKLKKELSENVEVLAKNVSRKSRDHLSSHSTTIIDEEEYDSSDTHNECLLNNEMLLNTSSRSNSFHQNSKTSHSPIPSNKFTSSCTLLLKKPEKVRTPKLSRRATKRACRRMTYVGDIYNEEYLEDIIRNMRAIETSITLPTGFLENFNADKKIRAAIVNWMLKIQRQIRISDGEFYLAVNLMDQILARIAVPMNMYQLLAITTIWISNKSIGSKCLTGSDMVDLGNNAYIIKQLVRMEKKVLKILDFQLHSIEPSICVNFYMKYLEIENLEIVRYSVYFILDCSTLLPEYSVFPITVLATAALNVAVRIYCNDLEEMVSQFFNAAMSKEYAEKRKIMESQMHSLILNMKNEKYVFREAFFKYETVHKYILFL